MCWRGLVRGERDVVIELFARDLCVATCQDVTSPASAN